MKGHQLGDKVHFSDTIERTTTHAKGRSYYRAWVRRGDLCPDEGPQSGVGYVVGARTLSDGLTTDMEEDGLVYKPSTYHRALLIAYNIRRKPVLVLVEDAQPLPKESA